MIIHVVLLCVIYYCLLSSLSLTNHHSLEKVILDMNCSVLLINSIKVEQFLYSRIPLSTNVKR